MPSSFKYNKGKMTAAFLELYEGAETGAKEAMQKVVKQAAKDAQAMKEWRDKGWYDVDYPSGNWLWEVTGMAKASIQGYVVPNKVLMTQPRYETQSYWEGVAKQKVHETDNSVTGTHSEERDKVIGIVTMNIAYAPYLQDYEMSIATNPVTVEVFEANWASAYVPRIIQPTMERVMGRIARKYT